MPNALIQGAALALSIVGMGWLALSMESHWQQVRGEGAVSPKNARLLRVLGALALVTSLLLCLRADHPSMAVLVWVMALAGAVLTVAMTLAWRARLLAPLVAWLPG